MALEWILHRRTGCCWRPAGVEESDLLEHNHTANSEYNALYLTDKIGKKIAIRYCFSENVKAFYAGGWSYRGSLWSGTAGPCPTSRATEASPRGAQQTGNRLPTRPPGGRTECLPPAVQGRDTSGSQRSRCSSHTDQLPNTEMHKIQHHFNYQWKHA